MCERKNFLLVGKGKDDQKARIKCVFEDGAKIDQSESTHFDCIPLMERLPNVKDELYNRLSKKIQTVSKKRNSC